MNDMLEEVSALDQEEVLSLIFHPRKNVSVPPPDSSDYFVPVDKEVSVACRFYTHNLKSASVLCFHGDGEVICDYDYIAPLYAQLGINLFVAEYRGYGASQGKPLFSTMLSDALAIFDAFMDALRAGAYKGPAFVIGRSLGSVPALEIARHHQKQIKGLIIESGFSSILKLLLHMDFPIGYLNFKDIEFPNVTSIRFVAIPTLIIHGKEDTLIPPGESQILYENSAAKNKRLVIIPGADHSNIIKVGMEPYLKAIKKFVRR
ncbi:MAG: alpha/beta hydrolase [Dehalococcoidia bacterium]|nr:alpha/beta hydrolase [Dehalococcoidia bacterium]